MALKKVATNEEIKAPVDCAYAGCRYNATVRILTNTGWANMCKHHHELWHLAQAKTYSAGLGLKTIKELRFFCLNHVEKVGKGKMHGAFKAAFERHKPVRMQIRERVPGEDDEPIIEEQTA